MIKKRKAILDVLTGKEPERIPIWLMRQAGRYLPEYRKLRKRAGNFLDLCLTPKLAAEITLQPIKRFDFDAAILFADILLIPRALGQRLEFREKEGPLLEKLEDDKKSFKKLVFDQNKLATVYETLETVKDKLPSQTTLIGFCGGAWTVAAYMIDGTSKDNFHRAKSWATGAPESLDRLIEILLDVSENYLCHQIKAGAEALQIFESWAGLLEGAAFDRWIIEPTRTLVSRVKRKYPHIPIIGFPRNAATRYHDYAGKTGVDAVSIDQHVKLDYAQTQLQPLKLLQGNLDPLLLVEGGENMRRAAKTILDAFGTRHIFNLGHGVLPQTRVEHVCDLVEFVRGFKDFA